MEVIQLVAVNIDRTAERLTSCKFDRRYALSKILFAANSTSHYYWYGKFFFQLGYTAISVWRLNLYARTI